MSTMLQLNSEELLGIEMEWIGDEKGVEHLTPIFSTTLPGPPTLKYSQHFRLMLLETDVYVDVTTGCIEIVGAFLQV